ncbi:MAG: hypothetical protein JWL99_114 [Streptomyces oryziradicis]|nr:hypothetical protein [Actinacidiphila oryziradicis]
MLALTALLALATALLSAGGTARGETSVQKIAGALRSSPVYVDPAAPHKPTARQAHELADRIRSSGLPV